VLSIQKVVIPISFEAKEDKNNRIQAVNLQLI